MMESLKVRRGPLMGILSVAVLTSVSACSDLFGSGTGTAAVSFHVPSAAALNADAAAVIVTGNGHTLDVTSVDVVVDEVTLERAGTTSGDADSDDSDTDSDSDGAHNARVRVGASTISLPLTGGVITPFTGSVPAGTYDRLELDVRYLRVRGTYDGQAFDVTIPVNAEYELRLDPPTVVAEGSDPVNFTVNVDVMSWFRTADGSVVDLQRLQTDAAYRAAFVTRLRASLRALEDSDRDGDESDSDSD